MKQTPEHNTQRPQIPPLQSQPSNTNQSLSEVNKHCLSVYLVEGRFPFYRLPTHLPTKLEELQMSRAEDTYRGTFCHEAEHASSSGRASREEGPALPLSSLAVLFLCAPRQDLAPGQGGRPHPRTEGRRQKAQRAQRPSRKPQPCAESEVRGTQLRVENGYSQSTGIKIILSVPSCHHSLGGGLQQPPHAILQARSRRHRTGSA